MLELKTRSVEEIMTKDVRTLREGMTVAEAIVALRMARVRGAPVLNAEGRCVGVFSTTDLALRETALRPGILDEDAMHAPVFFSFDPMTDWDDDVVATARNASCGDSIADWMTRDLRAVEPSASVSEACAIMTRERVHRLLVLDEGVLCGIVSASDVVRMVAERAAWQR